MPFNAGSRQQGVDWPLYGLSMAGTARLNNIERLLTNLVEADYLEILSSAAYGVVGHPFSLEAC